MVREKIVFIINPVSGSQSKAALPILINKYLNKKKYDHQIVFTDYKGQGSEITSLAVANDTSVVVAVGGDGTVNEIAKVLVDTNVALSIIPAGSGNGLARHLNVPRDFTKAIRTINTGRKIFIDAGKINERLFFCTAGVGFDAHIGNLFAKKLHRGFKGYISAITKEFFSYVPEVYRINNNDKEIEREAFLITFANASQYGNNAYIAPHANMQDNFLDVCIINKFPVSAGIGLGWKIFTKDIFKSKYVEFLKTKELVVFRKSPGMIHLDGEPLYMISELKVTAVPAALKVIVPENFRI